MTVDPVLIAHVRAELAASAHAARFDAASGKSPEVRARVRLVAGHRQPVDEAQLDELCAALFGYGPLQRFIDDSSVSDILVNGPDRVYVERRGRLELTTACFRDSAQLDDLIFGIAAAAGRELTLERPYLDARLSDGSRANAVIAPVGGPTLCIRKARREALPLRGHPSWVASGSLSAEAAEFLEMCIDRAANLLIAGPTGSGKSTLLRALADRIPAEERVIVIEDTIELLLTHPHVVRLECVPPRETHVGVRVADLVDNALRMRPDRIIVGEIRTPREASAALEALATGHPGSATTVHGADAVEALARLELLLLRADSALPIDAARGHVRRAFDIIVTVARAEEGRRLVRAIDAVTERGPVPLFERAGGALHAIPGHLTSAIGRLRRRS
jgi:pilus assembly protein CpaF